MKKERSTPAKPMNLSPDLEAIIGKGPMTKREACDKLWGHMGKKGPEDPSRKVSIEADEKLQRVFGGKKEITKDDLEDLISPHLS